MADDPRLIRTIPEQVEAIFNDAVAQIATLMERHGEAVSVGVFAAALVYELSQEELEKAKAGELDPKPHMKFCSNIMEAKDQLEFLAMIAEGLAQEDVDEVRHQRH